MPKDRIEKPAGVHHVKIERHQFAAEMQLGIVVQRPAAILIEPVFHSPPQNVSERVKVEMKLERDAIIEPQTFVINFIVVNQTAAERHDAPFLPPNKEPHALRHGLAHPNE